MNEFNVMKTTGEMLIRQSPGAGGDRPEAFAQPTERAWSSHVRELFGNLSRQVKDALPSLH